MKRWGQGTTGSLGWRRILLQRKGHRDKPAEATTFTPGKEPDALGDPTTCLGMGSRWLSTSRSLPRPPARPPAVPLLMPLSRGAIPPSPVQNHRNGRAAGDGDGVIVFPVKHQQLPGSACHHESRQSRNLSLEHSALIAGKVPRAYFLILTKHLCMKDLMPGIKHIIVNLPLIKPN